HRIYDSYFTYFGRTDSGKAIYEVINRNQSYTVLRQILAADDVFRGDTLRDLVILKNLHDEFYRTSFNRNALIHVLDSFRLHGQVTMFRPVAANILKKVTRLMAGYPPPPFRLQDSHGNIRTLEDFKGRYVYLNFCYCSSYSCLKEFEMLNTLYKKLKGYFEIVTILADPTLQKVTDFLNQNDYAWTFLHYGQQPDILKDYDIRAFPTYFLIGPDGKLILSPAPSPAENFQQTLFNIMRSRGDLK
nr:TlpA disulfide reductase family protein [Bacteroidales bacterium]